MARVHRLVIICATLLILFGSLVPAASATRPLQRDFTIYDASSDAYSPFVAQSVADWNAVLDNLPHAPHLVYERIEPAICLERNRRMNVIIVCEFTRPLGGEMAWRQREIRLNTQRGIDAGPEYQANVACHEFAHWLLQLGDDYDSMPGQSCLYGRLTTPGPYDIAYATSLYSEKHQKTQGHKRHKKGVDKDRRK